MHVCRGYSFSNPINENCTYNNFKNLYSSKTENIFIICKRGYYINLGASNHSKHAREEKDYYATDPIAGELLLEVEPELDNIWEYACGQGHLAKIFRKVDKLNKASDIVNRGYGSIENFLTCTKPYNKGDIVTNPPLAYDKFYIF